MKDKSFLGTGWAFPPTFYKDNESGVEMVSNEADIEQSLGILLNTSIGERIMEPRYGCDLYTYLFDSISNSRVHLITEIIRTAIINYEPRIKLLKVNLDESNYLDGVIRISLDYIVPLSNTRFNLVFPYYKVEGTDIPDLFKKQVRNPKDFSEQGMDTTKG
ncbi:GPW/gp25 family protein [Flavivirga aquimarina]|uniref:GPW/gp25 family protein n=1 Tax=Flavivirga aquimarina TaxID=2027862 RepID=A0ABT8W7A9_9FLAO|nr:GPW/gp25 family protein [Flavivirga aquimarina]MDO5968964.1 GPW/gp25 family protein [Flavivirga aquimarina]